MTVFTSHLDHFWIENLQKRTIRGFYKNLNVISIILTVSKSLTIVTRLRRIQMILMKKNILSLMKYKIIANVSPVQYILIVYN